MAGTVEEKLIQRFYQALGVEPGTVEEDVVSWISHGLIAYGLTQFIYKIVDHFNLGKRDTVALMVALLFVYREVSEDDGMDNLDSIMDIVGPIAVAAKQFYDDENRPF